MAPITAWDQCFDAALASTDAGQSELVYTAKSAPGVWAGLVKVYDKQLGCGEPCAILYPASHRHLEAAVACAYQSRISIMYTSGIPLDLDSFASKARLVSAETALSPQASLGPLVIDMGSFRELSYDPRSRSCRIGPGTRLGELHSFLARYEVMLPASGEKRSLTVGTVGDYALCGGYGLSARLHGLLLDSVESMEVMLANGTTLHLSHDANIDLFWAMRGAPHSFAIPLSITFMTHAVPSTVIHYSLVMEMSDLPEWDRNATVGYSSPITRAADFLISMQDTGDSPMARKEIGLSWRVRPVKREEDGSWEMQVGMHGYFVGSEVEYEGTIGQFRGLFEDSGVSGVVESHLPMTYAEALRHSERYTFQDRLFNEDSAFKSKPPDRYLRTRFTSPDMLRSSMIKHLSHLARLARVLNPEDGNVDWLIDAPYIGGLYSQVRQLNIVTGPRPELGKTAFAHRGVQYAWEFHAKRASRSTPLGVNLTEIGDGLAADLPEMAEANPTVPDPLLPVDRCHQLRYGRNYRELQTLKRKYDPHDLFWASCRIPLAEETLSLNTSQSTFTAAETFRSTPERLASRSSPERLPYYMRGLLGILLLACFYVFFTRRKKKSVKEKQV